MEEIDKHQRHLPHWRLDGSVYHIAFRSKIEELPPNARQILLDIINSKNGILFRLYVGVVMPDHAHLLVHPLDNEPNKPYSLSDITRLIKGASARSINQYLGKTGAVWQRESYDHIIRNDDDFNRQAEYIFLNPVRAKLVSDPNDYPYLMLP